MGNFGPIAVPAEASAWSLLTSNGLEFGEQPSGLRRVEDLVERTGRVGIGVVEHQHNLFGVGMTPIDQVFNLVGTVGLGAAVGRVHPAPEGQRFAEAEQIGHAAAFVYCRLANADLTLASPEWCRRDFRLRLGHGRNHCSDRRLERTALWFGRLITTSLPLKTGANADAVIAIPASAPSLSPVLPPMASITSML